MKRETLQFAKQEGEKGKTIQIDKIIRKKGKTDVLGRHTEPRTRGPGRMGGLRGCVPYRVRQLATQGTWHKQFVQVCLLPVSPCHPSQRPSGAA